MIKLRHADFRDWAALFAWRNDPATRANSVEHEAIELSDHLKWLDKTLPSQKSKLLIAFDNSIGSSGLGVVRLDIDKDVAEVSITVDPTKRGRGLASIMLAELLDNHVEGLTKLTAKVRQTNTAALRAFVSVGFMLVSRKRVADEDGFVWLSTSKSDD